MRILTDLQACQSLPHKDRGIGRYALSLAAEMHRLRGDHELYIALNAAIPDSIEAVRAAMPADTNFAIWTGIQRTASERPENEFRGKAGKVVRDVAYAAWGADIHHVSSFFEGYADDVLIDIPQTRRVPLAVTLYDLIPLFYQDMYLADERIRRWYLSRVDALKRADLLMTISECTRRDAIEHLGIDPSRVVNISAAVDPMFHPGRPLAGVEAAVRARYGLGGRILLYTGGIDPRKNIGCLIQAFSRIEPAIRDGVQLVIVCGLSGEAARLLGEGASGLKLETFELI
jgi:glycosyltransferase involved in cell wall biosynthesis